MSFTIWILSNVIENDHIYNCFIEICLTIRKCGQNNSYVEGTKFSEKYFSRSFRVSLLIGNISNSISINHIKFYRKAMRHCNNIFNRKVYYIHHFYNKFYITVLYYIFVKKHSIVKFMIYIYIYTSLLQ